MPAELGFAPARRGLHFCPASGFIVAAVLAVALSLVVAACGTGVPPAQSDAVRAPGSVELNKAPPNDIPPGGGERVRFSSTARFITLPLVVSASTAAPSRSCKRRARSIDLRISGGFRVPYRLAPKSVITPGQTGGGLWLERTCDDHAYRCSATGSYPRPRQRRLARRPRSVMPTVCYCDIDMTTASPPRLSMRPVRFAFRCMMTPFSFSQPKITAARSPDCKAIAGLAIGARKVRQTVEFVNLALGVDR